jgi:molybdenum cofactor cytidylyltransferase
VEVVFNPDWEAGLSTSIRAGLRGLPEATGSAVFLLADQPQIPADLIQELRRTRARTQAWIVSPEYKGQRANPVLFGWELFDQLNALEGDTGGRALIQRSANYPMVSVSWDSSNLVWDLDEPSDYQSLMETDKL